MTPTSSHRGVRCLILAALLLFTAGASSALVAPRSAAQNASAQSLVAAAIAGDQGRVEQLAAELKTRPRPARGDRRLARELNEHGLALWQRRRFEEAAAIFMQAHHADASDAEIAENLGYALLKSGRIAQAEAAILKALALAPERASAWGTLGLVYAKQGKQRDAISCVLTAYRYTGNRKRALEAYTRLATTDEDPRVRAMLAEVVTRLKR